MKKAIIAGSTGLIGSELLSLLLESPRYTEVIALTRRPLTREHSKLQIVETDLHQLKDHANALVADDVYCCLGTTMAKAGSKDKFYEVDYQYPLELARITKQNGAKQFMIVTALGSNAKSKIFYNRVKGEVEQAVEAVGFESLHIFRPSLLLGDRAEKRRGEQFATGFFRIFGFAVPMKFEPINVNEVAKAMLHFASLDRPGKLIHLSHEMHRKFY